jgi:hypothetical protein
MRCFCARWTLLAVFLANAYAAVDVNRTFELLREGEQLSGSAAAKLEIKLGKKPNDLENRLRLLSYYAGQQDSTELETIRAARARHVMWLIRHEPKAAVFDLATRVYSIQPTGGVLADPAGFQATKEEWQRQLSEHPRDNELKRKAATFLEIHEPNLVESLLTSTGDDRWLGQVYAKAILGIVALDYKTSDPVSASDERRSSEFAEHALVELEHSNNAALLAGAGFTLNRDGSSLYADGKLNWDYVPLAKRLLDKAQRIDPSNTDAFSVEPQLPARGERLPVPLRLGGAQLMMSLKRRVEPVRPVGVPASNTPVRVNLLVGLDGTVVRALAVDGPAALREAAMVAVKQWVFSPTASNGKPVYILSVIDLLF